VSVHAPVRVCSIGRSSSAPGASTTHMTIAGELPYTGPAEHLLLHRVLHVAPPPGSFATEHAVGHSASLAHLVLGKPGLSQPSPSSSSSPLGAACSSHPARA